MRDKSETIILVIDDNPTNLGVLFNYLQAANYQILIARDGPTALERAIYTRPDLILLDVLLPGVDGFEICRRLKENEQTQDIPVIFMTVLTETGDKLKGFNMGAVDYITKPLQPEELLARVDTHLTIRRLQKNLQAQIEERDRLIAELDAFAHTVAHDLKDPIGLINSYVALLQEELFTLSTEEKEQALNTMERIGQKSLNIVEELQLLAGIRKKEEVELTPLDMATIVEEAWQRLAHRAKKNRAEIHLPLQWPQALGYAPWVEEVWVNYLSNAIKYGGDPPRIEVGAAPHDQGQIRFWVRDNGPGLSPQEQAQLFTPFTRLHQVQTGGHGLGLSIVQRIVTRLGGQVGVESGGQGSLFSFTLPAA